MSLRIQNNIAAFDAERNLNSTSSRLQQSMARLSSGYRINTAADDAAGLAISEKLRAQIGGLSQANSNAQDGISLVQTAEGSLNEVHSMLQRVRDLAVQYKNGTLSTDDRTAIQSEVNQLGSEIERIGNSAAFNGISLLANSAHDHVPDRRQRRRHDLGVDHQPRPAVSSSVFSLSATGTTDISEIDSAINAVSAQRATFGAVQNRLEHTINNLSTYQENLTASESQIRDVDMASEMVEFTKDQILQQAGTSMLSQANQLPNSVLSLLR